MGSSPLSSLLALVVVLCCFVALGVCSRASVSGCGCIDTADSPGAQNFSEVCCHACVCLSVLCGLWVCFNFLWSALRASHVSKLVCAAFYINTVVVSSPPVRWTSPMSRVKSHVPISKGE